MKIIGVRAETEQLVLKTPKGKLFLRPYADGIIRVTYRESDRDFPSPLEIAPQKSATSWKFKESGESVELETALIKLAVNKSDGRMTWRDSDGKPLLGQPFLDATAQPVIKYARDDSRAEIRKVKTVDGERSFVGNLKPYEDRIAFRAKIFFDWQENEAIHGLGQFEEGIYDYRGKTQYLYQHNMRIPVPFLVSDKNYGVLFDCGSLMTFNDDSRGSYVFLDTVDAPDYYFIHAKSLDGVIAGFRELTGRAVLPPKWAFGYVQSKEAYKTQDELVEIAREYRRRHIPLDCVVQDWNTWEPGKWGDKHVDKSRYSDLAGATEALREMNVHSMVSVWPNMNEGGPDHSEFEKVGLLLADDSTYDAFDENARRVYWKQAERELFSGGFDSWWCDSTEPFSGPDWGGETLREPWERYELVGGEHKKFLDPAKANLFALTHAKGIYENQRAVYPEKRVLNLTRSGSAGSQKYGAVLWSGDISAKWDTLKKQIPEGLNMCMSGIPWWTLDIGGFFVLKDNWQNRGCGQNDNPNPLWFWDGDFEDGANDPAYRELYVRWLQMGTFLPMFRSHGTDTPREIWRFGESGDCFYDAIEKFIRLRYQLIPYIYSIAGEVMAGHYTMLRSLVFDFSHDETAKKIADQFMLGAAILVCPVMEPMYYGTNGSNPGITATRSCYLPSGTKWHDFWSGEIYDGGQRVSVPAPLDRIPLFVRAGSIIPMETAKLEYACQVTDEPLEIRVYPGADGEFTLYEDDGDGYNYEKGEYNRINIRWNNKSEILYIGEAKYSFPQSINGRKCVIRIGDAAKEIFYNGGAMEIQ